MARKTKKNRQRISKGKTGFKHFLKFLGKKKTLGVIFFLVLLNLVLLPPVGYYAEVQAIWKEAKVLGTHFVIPPPTPLAKNSSNVPSPFLTAKAALVMDVPSATILYEKNATLPLPPASTTKIMTALVSLEHYLVDQALEVKEIYREGQNIKLEKGERMTAESFLYALLVASANDAAETLAANYEGGRQSFIGRMNQKAKMFGLENSSFVNPSGIDEGGQSSSAFDLARLSAIAIRNPLFSQIVATPKVVIYNTDKTKPYPLSNINVLLEKSSVIKGIKTGWTLLAGECLVGLAEKDGRQIIVVVLGSEDRFGETMQLVNWVFDNFIWEIPV